MIPKFNYQPSPSHRDFLKSAGCLTIAFVLGGGVESGRISVAGYYPGRHVRRQWSRDDEHAWEPYGSALLLQIDARLDTYEYITHLSNNIWSDTHSTRPGGQT